MSDVVWNCHDRSLLTALTLDPIHLTKSTTVGNRCDNLSSSQPYFSSRSPPSRRTSPTLHVSETFILGFFYIYTLYETHMHSPHTHIIYTNPKQAYLFKIDYKNIIFNYSTIYIFTPTPLHP